MRREKKSLSSLISCLKNICQTDKPNSVPHRVGTGHALSLRGAVLSFISTCLHRQALSAYPSTSGEQPLIVDIRGVSPHKVYPPPDLRRDAVRSYRTFSPLPEVHGFIVRLLDGFIVRLLDGFIVRLFHCWMVFYFFAKRKKQSNNETMKP